MRQQFASWARKPTAMSRRTVGVAFDDQTIRAVELAPAGRLGRPSNDVVTKAIAFDLPPGVVDQGEISDVGAFRDCLRELWSEAGFSTKRIAVGLDARAAVIRRAIFPPEAKRGIQQAAEFEIADLLSYPIDEALVSVLDIGSQGSLSPGTVQSLILATRQQTVLDLRQSVKAAGLRLESIELTQAALTSSISRPNPLPEDSIGVLVDVSTTVTSVIVHDNDGILFTRVVTAGISASSTSLSDELQKELSILEEFGRNDDHSGHDSVAIDPAVASSATVVEGIRRTLRYVQGDLDTRTIGRITLCGIMSVSRSLASDLAELFPQAEILRHEHKHWPADTDDASQFDEALAVAHAATTTSLAARTFDLVPTVVRDRRAGMSRIGAGVAVAIAMSPVLMANAMDRSDNAQNLRTSTEAVERVVEELRTDLSALDDDQAQEAAAARQTDRVNELLNQEYGFTTVIRQLAEAAPQDSFLLSLRIQRAQRGESPIGYNGSQPGAILSVTGVTEDLGGVGSWLQSVEEVPSLSGLWLAQSATGPYSSEDRTAAVFTIDGAVVTPAVTVIELDPLR